MKKNDDKPKDMVAREQPKQNTFRVTKPDEVEPDLAEQLAQEVANEEAEIAAVEEGIAQRKQEMATKAAKAAEAARQDKLNKRSNLLEDATDWREMARTNNDPVKAKDYLRRAKDAEAEATKLGAELNLNDPLPEVSKEPTKLQPLSTNKAIKIIIGVFIAFLILTCVVGSFISADPNNAMGQSMISNAPLRALLSFTLTFLTFLVAVFFIRVAFPQFYRIWHNRIDSERSLESLINESPAWAVLLFLLGLFYTFMQLFASFYQSLYA
ncbi:hypothetical protein M0L20_13565 [Spirosoma sp. RP8]|uniref:Uncharacterized protein n=1 Tax=Spirosoma liriopis TaxID=2937440 RepID=A0ABT0HMU5_9BACT|nr:hypothetical protein [Spirosoma liriopis]MCK8492890.1 hypothetical protein [Spirosoma liriopis]